MSSNINFSCSIWKSYNNLITEGLRHVVEYKKQHLSQRRKTREINVGKVKVGGNNPISVQSMTNTLTTDINATIKQINEIHSEGADIVRVSCPDEDSSKALKEITKHIDVPIVADIHFHYKRAIEAADNGASLIMEVTNYSDGEMGSYTQEGCEDDPSLYFYANLNCPTCDETELTVVQPTCETPEGLAYVTPDGEGPWNLTWLDPFGNIAAINNNITGPFSLTGLSPDDYYVIVEDTFDGCLFTIPFTVETPEDPIVDVQVFSTSCFGFSDGSIDITQVGEGTYEYTWTTPSGNIFTDEDLSNLTIKRNNLDKNVDDIRVTIPVPRSKTWIIVNRNPSKIRPNSAPRSF